VIAGIGIVIAGIGIVITGVVAQSSLVGAGPPQ